MFFIILKEKKGYLQINNEDNLSPLLYKPSNVPLTASASSNTLSVFFTKFQFKLPDNHNNEESLL